MSARQYREGTDAYRQGVKDRVKQKRKEDPPRYLWSKAKRRAERDGLPFDITPEDIVIPTHCPVLGIPLVICDRGPGSASVDKIIPTEGYVRGNILVVSLRANQLKRDATLEELQMLASYYGKFIPS